SDHVVVNDVYAASEAPITGISGETIADEIARHGHRGVSYQPRLEWVHRDVGKMLDSGDLVLSLGAGNIHEQLSVLAADLVIAEKLKAIVGEEGDVRLYEPLSKHTTLRVGGPAQFWVEPQNEKAFSDLIRFCRDEHLPLFAMGRGSNLLVRDGGIRGVVVHPRGGDFDKIEVNGSEITAGAGVKLREVAYAARGANLGGLEWMEGIPGVVGGALRMNAGAMGAQTFESVTRIRYLDADGNPHVKNRDELEVFYRRFPLLQNNFAISATFRAQPAERAEIDSRLRESQEKRRTTQPIAKSAGCIFKNPNSIPAGKLVDELGLKNSRIGNARVSEVHGNFSEDGELQRILESRGIAYTGEGVKGSETAFDKIRTKEKFREHGVTTPPWEVIHPGQRPTFPLPLVVKAPRQGSTVGVVIVKSEGEIESAISEAAKYGRELLIEKFVSGRELTIGILGDQALPILEIIPKGGFYDFNN